MAPAGAAASASSPLPEPAWQSSWEAKGDPYEADVQLVDAVLDPASGDVFALGENSEVHDDHQLRRVDGETGATEWELPQPASPYSQLTLDADGGQLLLSHPVTVGGKRLLRLRALGLDGAERWSRDLVELGHVQEQVTDPASGTTCATTVAKAGPAVGGRRTQRWSFACVGRDGEPVAQRSFRRTGVTQQEELFLAVDPTRGRWYAAASREVRGQGSTVELQALDRRGRTRWQRTLSWSGRRFGSVGALTVDPARGRVLLGTAVHGGNRANSTTLTVWNSHGRRHAQRTWRGRNVDTITDLGVSADGRHYVVASVFARRGGAVADLRPGLRPRWTKRHGRGGLDDLDLVVDDARRQVLASGGDVAAYRWTGSRAWGGSPSRAYFGLDLLLDAGRGRLLAAWQEEEWPAAHLTAWRL
ncbi:hypothetical protein [Nocardioides solisilvae]|uniref:hypothetical protein n=1 Tax=Nocardioides solisilvae TaxID=1542435 RepID=UPI000D74FA50|nr:hypothetical protein [Nocardioides solisilvae]